MFLDWLIDDPDGQEQFVTTLNSIPAYDHFAAKPAGGISSDVLAYSEEGMTLPWMFSLWPQGYSTIVSDTLQEYVAGRISYDDALAELEEALREMM
jgi:raffinose/stachyose/melibiose transport system substrate-binding protein